MESSQQQRERNVILTRRLHRGELSLAEHATSKTDLWKFYKVLVDAQSLKPEGAVQCIKCRALFSYDSKLTGNSHLSRHLKRCSGVSRGSSSPSPSPTTSRRKSSARSTVSCASPESTPTKVGSSGIPSSLTAFFQSGSGVSLKLKQRITDAFVQLCTKDLRPFDVVTGEGFRHVCQEMIKIGATQGYINVEDSSLLPDPTTISRQVKKTAEKCRKLLVPILESVMKKGHCSATTDMWTDDYKKVAYTTFTVHYMEPNWELRKRILFTCDFPSERKTGDNIRKEITRRFSQFGLQPTLLSNLTFVTDQGANIVNALSPYDRLSCCAHILNTVLRHTFDSKFLAQPALRTLNETILSTKALVTFLKQAGLSSELPHTVHQEVETRWNSKLLMFKSVADQYAEITDLLEERHDVCKLDGIDLQTLIMLTDFLRPFKDASDLLERDVTCTLHLVIRTYYTLLEHLSQPTDSDVLKKISERGRAFLCEKFVIKMKHKIAAVLCPSTRQLQPLPRGEVLEVYSHLRTLVNKEMQEETRLLQNVEAIDEEQEQEQEPLPLTQLSTTTSSRSSTPLLPVDSPTRSELPTPSKKRKITTFSKFLDKAPELVEEKDEVDHYLELPFNPSQRRNADQEDDNEEDVLTWWRNHQSEFPLLSNIARKVLCIPASSASSERSFSAAGLVIQERRTALAPSTVDAVLFLNSNRDL